jgi:hypothetical protein
MDETSAHAACERLRANGVDALLDTELLEKEWGGFPARAVHIDADRPTVMVRDLNGNVWRLVPSA